MLEQGVDVPLHGLDGGQLLVMPWAIGNPRLLLESDLRSIIKDRGTRKHEQKNHQDAGKKGIYRELVTSSHAIGNQRGRSTDSAMVHRYRVAQRKRNARGPIRSCVQVVELLQRERTVADPHVYSHDPARMEI